MILLLKGQIPSGKNRIAITRTGHRYPTGRFPAWRDVSVLQVRSQKMLDRDALKTPFQKPCSIAVEYYPGDRIRRDAPGMIDALFHVLERAGVVLDDTLFKRVVWTERKMDRENPRVEIGIGEIE